MGGSGSPAPSAVRPGEAATAAILADLARSGIAKSGLGNSGLGNSGLSKSDLADPLADPCTAPCDDRLGMATFGNPVGGLGRKAALVDASGGGCGGSPAAIRCRAESASADRSVAADGFAGSEPIEAWSGGLPVVADPLLTRAALGEEPVAEAADEPRGRAASRPLPSGGALPEFTAYPLC